MTPHWLKAVAPEARVNSNVLKIFDSFKDGDQCFAQVMQSVTGKPHHRTPMLCNVFFLEALPSIFHIKACHFCQSDLQLRLLDRQ